LNILLYLFLGFAGLMVTGCGKALQNTEKGKITPAVMQMETYLPLLAGKSAGLVINHTSMVGATHLLDTLVARNIRVKAVFGPEHGFRGTADDGAYIDNDTDSKTDVKIISLYGKKRKPDPADLEGIDLMVFDIQDVGTRFYTFISTMHYAMEACAENNIPFIVLDRPNPNGHYVDGPIRKPGFESFVGMHPIPVVHGLTVGELATMINEEGWLANGVKCELEVIPVKNYSHKDHYSLPVKPSPNLPNDTAINLYPSLCFFEGTKMSVGRGTHFPFQVVGYPDEGMGTFSFRPESMPGMATHPKYEGETCYGIDLRNTEFINKIDLTWLIDFFNRFPDKASFFNNYFNTLAGTDVLKRQIEEGLSADEIRASWTSDITRFKVLRKKYLLYPDFE